MPLKRRCCGILPHRHVAASIDGICDARLPLTDQPIKAPATIAKFIDGAAPALDTPLGQLHEERIPFSFSDTQELRLDASFRFGAQFGGAILHAHVRIEANTGHQVFFLFIGGSADQDGTETEFLARVVFNRDANSETTHEDELPADQVTTDVLPAGSYVLVVSCKAPNNPNIGRNTITARLRWREPSGTFTKKVQGGGVGIATIARRYGFGNPDRITTYDYSMLEGEETISPGSLLESHLNYEQWTTYSILLDDGTHGDDGGSSIPVGGEELKFVRFSQNRSALGTTQGSHVGYQQVTVVEGVDPLTGHANFANGKSVYTFISPVDFPDFFADGFDGNENPLDENPLVPPPGSVLATDELRL
jgi:hypothetical protein